MHGAIIRPECPACAKRCSNIAITQITAGLPGLPVSVHFGIACALLHLDAIDSMVKSWYLQGNARRCAQVRPWRMRLRVSCSEQP